MHVRGRLVLTVHGGVRIPYEIQPTHVLDALLFSLSRSPVHNPRRRFQTIPVVAENPPMFEALLVLLENTWGHLMCRQQGDTTGDLLRRIRDPRSVPSRVDSRQKGFKVRVVTAFTRFSASRSMSTKCSSVGIRKSLMAGMLGEWPAWVSASKCLAVAVSCLSRVTVTIRSRLSSASGGVPCDG